MKITNVISFLPVSERKKCTLNCRGINKKTMKLDCLSLRSQIIKGKRKKKSNKHTI